MKSHVPELSYRCQSLTQFYKTKSLFLSYASKGKCPYKQSENIEANLPSFARMQSLLTSISFSRCEKKKCLDLSHYTFRLISVLF